MATAPAKAPFQFYRTNDCISLERDNILFRIYPKPLKFQLDRLGDIKNKKTDQEYSVIQRSAIVKKNVFGVFGYIKLQKVSHLILIEKATVVGKVLKGTVYRVQKLLFVPLNYTAKMTIDEEDEPYVQMIKKIQDEKRFYFSYDIDLTKNLQKTFTEIQSTKQGVNMNLDEQSVNMKDSYPNSCDYIPQYAFNDKLLGEFQGIEYSPFRIPCIFGFVYVSQPQFKPGAKTDFILISRKDSRRMGRRFVTRGLDRQGNAANFVETEHIFVQHEQTHMNVASYVQIRGSIPLLWTMKPNLKWSPPVKTNKNFLDSKLAAEIHFQDTKSIAQMYQKQYMVNLIDEKGSQLRIGKEFTKLYNELKQKDDDLMYTWFDFHGKCKKMKWENLSQLVNIVKDQINEYGSFVAKINVGFDERVELRDKANIQVIQEQTGCFRTNCMDCLDRTNVVQGVISRYIAFEQLQKLKLIPEPVNKRSLRSAFEKFPEKLEHVFREGWTDNADVMSYLYTGTPALKTDFTRTGKRTYMGAINDGVNSVTRYFINNFTDGYYHDCLDIATLNLNVNSKLKERKSLSPIKKSFFATIFLTIFAKFLVEFLILPHDQPYSGKQSILQLLVTLGTFVSGIYYILQNGRDFIDDASRMH